MFKQKLKLYNGVEIPQLGLGTWLIKDEDASLAVQEALKMGYCHIDTAEAYGNERGVGEGIKASGLKRSDIFLQTKLIAEEKTYEGAKKEIEGSLKRLGVDYIDLMIIHCPQPWALFRNGNHYFEGNLAAWKALIEYYQAGKIRAIGVSNFEKVDIENLIKNSPVKPMVNQILIHIGNTDFELIKYCQDNDIVIEAYSPIAHGELLNNKDVKVMSDKYKVSIAQLCVKYTIQLGLVSLPKTTNVEHMKNNATLDFDISEEDMKTLFMIDKIHDYGASGIFPCYSKQIKD
jgi:diketogulonate reductase-like aldo/keto reductase